MALFISPFVRAMNASGVLSGARLWFYESGSLDPASVYTTPALDTAHGPYVEADGGGLFPPIYLNPTVSYRVILKTAAGVTIQDIDPLDGTSTPTETVNVIDYGAVAGEDCTDAFQAAIDAIEAAGGGTIEIPFGNYLIDGPLLGTSPLDTQLALPMITGGSNVIQIRFQGVASPVTGDPANGVIIESSLTSGTGAMIGVRDATGSSEINVVFDNVILRAPQNSSITALDLSYVRFYLLDNSRVDVPNTLAVNVFDLEEPTHTTNYGIKFPLNDISAFGFCRSVVVVGYYYGARIGELVRGDLTFSACKYPYLAAAGSHPSHFDFIEMTNCPNGIKVDGTCEHWFDVWTIEHDTADGSGPDWVEPLGYDLDDPTNALHGGVLGSIHMHDFDAPLSINGGKNFRLRPNRPASDQFDFGLIFTGFDALTNMSSCTLTRGLFGGTPWNSLIGSQTNTSGLVGAISISNEGNGNTDIRMAQLSVICDGQTDRGRVKIGTAKDGTLGNALEIDSNNKVMLALLEAANDTAAGTAGVPTGMWFWNTTTSALAKKS